MEWAVASACLESCVLGEECVILLFQKEYAGLRVKIFYVVPNNSSNHKCVKSPCVILNDSSTNYTLPLLVNVEYHFSPGNYYISNNMVFTELHNFSIIGITNKRSEQIAFIIFSKTYLSIRESYNVTIINISFQKHRDSKLKKLYEDPTALVLDKCVSCGLDNITFTECRLYYSGLLGSSHLNKINISINTATLNLGLCYFGIVLKADRINKSVVKINEVMINGKHNPCHSTDSTHGVGIFIDLAIEYQETEVFITNSKFHSMSHTVIYLRDSCSSGKATVWFINCTFEYNNYIDIYTFRSMIINKLSGYNTHITFLHCSFHHNRQWTSVIMLTTFKCTGKFSNCLLQTTITFTACSFSRNKATLINFINEHSLECKINLHIIGPTKLLNTYIDQYSTIYSAISGKNANMIYLNNIKVLIDGPVTIFKNSAYNIMSFRDCDVQMNGPITVSENLGNNIIVFDLCNILLNKSILFIWNTANQNVIIISSLDFAYIEVIQNSNITLIYNQYLKMLIEVEIINRKPHPYCFFQYIPSKYKTEISVTSKHYTIIIINNFYTGYDNQTCHLTFNHYLFHCKWLPIATFHGSDPESVNKEIIQTDRKPFIHHTTICLCSNINEANCSSDAVGLIYPGQKL